jgi:hypothetical protein
MDRPRLVGWSSLHRERRRSLTSLVANSGTASPVPGPAGSWLAVRLASRAERSPAWPRSPLLCALRCKSVGRSRRLPSCRDRPGLPRGRRAALALVLESYARLAHRSRRGDAAACVSTRCGDLFGQCRGVHFPCGSSSASGTWVRRTDFCLLTSSYEHPRLVGSRCVTRGKRLRDRGDRLPHASAIRFGGPHVPSWRSPLRALSSRGDACWPCLWHPCRLSHDGHCARARMGRRQRRRGRLLRARVNDACWRTDPRCLPSIESLRPATPFRAPGSGLVPTPRCGHRDAGRRRPLARADPLGSGRARPPFTRTVASGFALLWVSASLADFCNR